MTDAAAELGARVEALLQAGVRGFDEPGTRVVQLLLERAAQSDAPLAEHLHRRAAVHLARLEDTFRGARTRAELAFSHLMERGPARLPALDTLRATLEAGGFAELQRWVRRSERRATGKEGELEANRRARLEAAAQRRGLAMRHGKSGKPNSEALARALYRDSAAEASTRRTLARAAASIPVDSGPYNAQRVAARMLDALSAHPAYLRAQLARLETLALMQPPPPPEPPPTKITRTRRSKPARSSRASS